MIKFASQNPTARANKVRDGLTILRYHENEFLAAFGVTVSQEMVQIRGEITHHAQSACMKDSDRFHMGHHS